MSQFVRYDLQIMHPIKSVFNVTTSDTVDLQYVTRAIYVGVSGDLRVIMPDNTIVTFVDLAAGIFHPIQIKRVMATGTTATDIIGLV